MRKTFRITAIFIAVVIISSTVNMCISVSAADAIDTLAAESAGYDAFLSDSRQYDGRFADVSDESWYKSYVAASYELRLIDGISSKRFDPDSNLTLGAAVKLAACLHSIYESGTNIFPSTDPWYEAYVEYAVSNGIIGGSDYSDYTLTATRAQTAVIFASALPDNALPSLRILKDGDIPDVSITDPFGSAVYKLYAAGILYGNDAAGTFYPNSFIKRSEISAIVTRLAVPSYRNGYNESKTVMYTMYSNINPAPVLSHSFIYSDAYFDEASSVFVPGLAKASAAISAASFRADPPGSYIYNAMTDMGYEVLDNVNYDNAATADNYNIVAYTIGKRTIIRDNNIYNVYCLCIRGTQGDEEWLSNIDIGTDGGNHNGIEKTAQWLYTDIEKYIDTDAKNNILWITGHSRGAGVANMLSVICQSNNSYASADNIYTYTLASPNVTINEDDYDNIFNIINPGDVVTSIPVTEWGYRRYGIDVILSSESDTYAKMKANYTALTGTGYKGILSTAAFARVTYLWCPQPSDFYRNIVSNMSPHDIFYAVISGTGDLESLLNARTIIELTLRSPQTIDFIEYYLNHTEQITHAHAYESYIAWLDAQFDE